MLWIKNYTKAFKLKSHQNIKVSDALKKGIRWINFPAYILLFSFIFIVPAILLYVFRNDKNSTTLIVFGISSVVLGIILPIFWWSINIVKYKIWAGYNVKDIHRFYIEAQSKNLINESKFFKRLEIKSQTQKKELSKFYERLNSENRLIRDINNSISKETIFKSGLGWNIAIYSVLSIASVFLYFFGNYNLRFTLIIQSVLLFLIGVDIYKMLKHKYILKINDTLISYKDDKSVIYWKDIAHFITIPGIGYNPSKLIISTENENLELTLENYGSIKLSRVIDVLNENKHRFEVKQSTR